MPKVRDRSIKVKDDYRARPTEALNEVQDHQFVVI